MRLKSGIGLACAAALASLAGTSRAGPIILQNATATFSQANFSIAESIDGSFDPALVGDDGNGWAIFRDGGITAPETAAFETAADLGSAAGTNLTFTFRQLLFTPPEHTLGRFRLSATTDDRSAFADGLSSGGDVSATWTILTPLTAVASGGATLTVLGDGSILAGGASPATATYSVSATTFLAGITGFRLEVLEDPSLPFAGPGRQPTNGNFVLTEFQVDAAAVPEPASLISGGLAGLAGLGYAGWRRRKAKATA